MNKISIPKFKNSHEREEFWLEVCQKFISSGLSKVSFCRTTEISEAALYRWLRHYKSKSAPKQVTENNAAKKSFFVPMKSKINNLSFPASGVEVLLPNGLKVITSQTLSAALISELMKIEV
jgi:hypothetical protein